MAVHYAQIALFPLVAWSECRLVAGMAGYAAALCRTAMFVFAVSYVAFDTAAGVVTGVLVGAARATNSPEAWRAPVYSIWNHAVIGGRMVSALGLFVFRAHAWPGGPLSFGALALAAAGIAREDRRA